MLQTLCRHLSWAAEELDGLRVVHSHHIVMALRGSHCLRFRAHGGWLVAYMRRAVINRMWRPVLCVAAAIIRLRRLASYLMCRRCWTKGCLWARCWLLSRAEAGPTTMPQEYQDGHAKDQHSQDGPDDNPGYCAALHGANRVAACVGCLASPGRRRGCRRSLARFCLRGRPQARRERVRLQG